MLRIASLLVLALILLASCEQGSPTVTTPPPPPPDFTLSLNPSSLSLQQGQTGTTTLTLTPRNGFTGTVSLSLVNPPSGVSLSPGSLTVSGSSPTSQALTLSVGQGVAPGTYNLQVRVVGGGITREANLSLTVTTPPPPPNFTLSLSPTALTVERGRTGEVTLTLTPQGGFQDQVSLSLVGAPGGVSLSPTAVQVAGSAPVSQALTLNVGSAVNPGTYPLKVRATSGNLTREAEFSLTVISPSPPPDFTIALSPTSLAVERGSSGTTTLTLTPQNGFTGTVSLALVNAPSGVTLAPTGLSVPGPNPVTQTLTLAVASTTPAGTYSLQVRATGGGLTREANLSLTVTTPPPPPDFTLSLSPQSLTVERGKTGTATLTLTPQGGFTGQISLSLETQDGSPVPNGLTLAPTGLNVAGTSPVTQTLALSVGSAVDPGTYPLRVRATSGSLSRTASLSLAVTQPAGGDFSLALEGSSLSVAQGGKVYVRLVVSGSYTGPVALSLVDASKNPFSGVSLSPTSTPVPSAPMLELSTSPDLAPGTYSLFVRGQGGGLVREAALTLTVTAASPPDFTLSLSPQSLTVERGKTGTATLTLTPRNGFTGTVSLSLVNPPSGVSLSPTSLSVPGPDPVSQTLTLAVASTTPAGTYSLQVRAVGGGLTKEANLSLTVIASSSSPNLRLAKAEWGQSVLKESLRLVAGKPALLRVHLLASPSPISLSNALSGAVYLNSTFQGNLSFTCPNPIPTAADPGSLATTCNATLPAAWVAPGLRVELRADPQDQVAEANEGDNALTLTPSVGSDTVLYLTVVPVIHQGQQAQVPSFSQTLWRLWPLKEVSSTTRAPYTFSGTLGPNDGNSWSQLLGELRLLRQSDGSQRYYYGFVKVAYTSGIAGIGYVGYPVAAGWDYPSSAPLVMAHELGHNFGREHAPCGVPDGDPSYPYAGGGIGTWGYDLATGTLRDPGQFYDLMSYCSPAWISDYTYEGAQAFLESRPPQPQGLPQEGLLFTGRIRNGQVVLNPPLRLRAAPEGEPSPYRLLAEVPGQASPLEVPVYTLLDSEGTLHFQALLPVGPYARVGLYLGANLLKAVAAPLVPLAEPQVSLAEEGGFLRVRLQGYPYFSLFHLAQDGTRTTLGLWHPAGEVRFPLQGLPPGGEWEVQVSDGLGVRVLRFAR